MATERGQVGDAGLRVGNDSLKSRGMQLTGSRASSRPVRDAAIRPDGRQRDEQHAAFARGMLALMCGPLARGPEEGEGSTPAWIRTRTSTFGGWRDDPFHYRGVEFRGLGSNQRLQVQSLAFYR